jgi:hypothetical protein
MSASLKYSVQIMTDSHQLTEALSLRYRTYSKVFPKLTENLNRPYESDSFDARSIHLGLYSENGIEKKLAGYCRLIVPEFFEENFSNLLIKKHPKYLNKLQRSLAKKLAFIERLPGTDYERVNSFCNSLEEDKIIYAETSRFIIDENHRSISLSSFFVSSMFAVCESLKIKYSFFTCSCQGHAAFYSKYGLTPFPGIAPFQNEIFRTQLVLFGTNLNVINEKKDSIETLKLQLEKENRITFKRVA